MQRKKNYFQPASKHPNALKEFFVIVRNWVFLTDRNDRTGQLSGQSGRGSCDGRKRCVGISHSSRGVRTFALNHFGNLIPLYQPELAK